MMIVNPREITSSRGDRVRDGAEAWLYYEGKQRRPGGARNNERWRPPNHLATLVDTIVDHLGRHTVSWGDDELAAQLEERHRVAMDENDADLLDSTTETSCAVTGDGAFKVTWDDERAIVRIAGVDASRLWVATDPNDPARAVAFAHQYTVAAEHLPVMFGSRIGVPLSGRDEPITEYWSREAVEVWVGQELADRSANPYGGLLPYVHFPNVRRSTSFWGVGDVAPIRYQQDRISEQAYQDDLVARVQGAIIVIENADGSQDLSIQPGTIWALPADAKAYVLEILSGPTATARLERMRELVNEMRSLARVPAIASGGLQDQQASQASGLSLQLQFGPLLRLVARKRLTRSVAYRERARLIAALGSQFAGAPDAGTRRPVIDWQDAIPADRTGELANAIQELALGRSRDAILRSLGVEEPLLELAARAAEDAALAPKTNTAGGTP